MNGDQSGTGKSKFTYRPFTLEGNFAFAEGIQEMLMQSHGGVVRVFPAVPNSWRDVSFSTLRAEGALLVSAVRAAGKTRSVRIVSEKGGIVKLADPFAGIKFRTKARGVTVSQVEGGLIELNSAPKGMVEFTLR